MLRILVADDVPIVRAGLKLLLETHEGWSVCGEAGGEDAVQKAFALNPDVVLLDVAMPDLNGIDAAERIREAMSVSKIVFLTQDHDADLKSAALNTGAEGYMVKANAATELLSAIATALSNGNL